MKSQAGFTTLDFLFSLMVAFGMSAILFALSFTLMVTEVGQYVAYSSARAMIASNSDINTQKDLARKKYKNLTADPKSPIANFFTNGWFVISKPEELDVRVGTGQDYSQELAGVPNGGSGSNGERTIFTGIRMDFEAKLLELKIPFMGNTADEGSHTFQTKIYGILIRESTHEECMNWYEARKAALANLPSGKNFYKQDDYVAVEDNGC